MILVVYNKTHTDSTTLRCVLRRNFSRLTKKSPMPKKVATTPKALKIWGTFFIIYFLCSVMFVKRLSD